ncbi:hypothetical protein GQ600_8473 [Phytophthora cactorum]|nr:hypothetical protein GQ600_8473 [Phytophthora cactorum]
MAANACCLLDAVRRARSDARLMLMADSDISVVRSSAGQACGHFEICLHSSTPQRLSNNSSYHARHLYYCASPSSVEPPITLGSGGGRQVRGRYESTGSSELQPRQTPDLARHFRDSAMHRHTMESLATRMISTPSEADVSKRVELTRASPFPQSFWSNTISLTHERPAHDDDKDSGESKDRA